MSKQDIIDNRNEKLIDHVNGILETSVAARFAVGYLFLSGLKGIGEKLAKLRDLKILIGGATNQRTIEELAECYRRLDPANSMLEQAKYRKRVDSLREVESASALLRSTIERMEQSDENETLMRKLAEMIADKRLKIRVYTKGRLHAKAYIFDYEGRYENGIAIVGSSNLTLAGLTHNTELNVLVHGNENHKQLAEWFENLWKESVEFDRALMEEINQSWALAPTTPYDIYMKTLYSLVSDRLDDRDSDDILWEDEITDKLAKFQQIAVKQAVQMIRDHGGAFVSDVVGLGKSFIGAAITKHFQRIEGLQPLIICPRSLVEMWEGYNEQYDLNARVLSMGMLQERVGLNGNILLEDVKYRDRRFVLLDESHNFRHSDTQRYRIIQQFLAGGRRCCFLTATPRNKSAWDIYHQIKLFHPEEQTDLPINPPNLADYFRLVERGERRLQDMLPHILIRRKRNHILRWYGYDAETHRKLDPNKFRDYLDGSRRAYVLVGGRHNFFPRRELETVEYCIEDTYQGLYQRIRGHLGKPGKRFPLRPVAGELTYARYGLWHYVDKNKRRRHPYDSLHQAGANLRGLIRVLLFKRFESSVYAFQQTISKMLAAHENFLRALDHDIVPAGEEAQEILKNPNDLEEEDFIRELGKISGKYNAADFDTERLREHIAHDIELFKKILKIVEPITPDKDAKLRKLTEILKKKPLSDGKRLIFTQFADTAHYLHENLNPGGARDDIDVIYSGDKSKARLAGRFAPKANPEFRPGPDQAELMTVIATDVLAEGLNLQDCDKIINYDLHWNPVKLIQRFGRIDRIGTEHDLVYAFNFLPEVGIERNLGLQQKLHNRIQEIHDTIGEDSYILDKSEKLNEDTMYAIYENDTGQLGMFEDEDDDDFIDLNEAEELFRRMRSDEPEEFKRIAALRDGIRSGMASTEKGTYVFCEAEYPGREDMRGYQQLFLIDSELNIKTKDLQNILRTIKCGANESAVKLSKNHNAAVMRVHKYFEEEVQHRHSQRHHSAALTLGQKYVIRELGLAFNATDDDGWKKRINLLEKAFRGPLTKAVTRKLNRIRGDGITGENLVKRLAQIYHDHNLKEMAERDEEVEKISPVARIICSESLM